jgi:hypothetical protein
MKALHLIWLATEVGLVPQGLVDLIASLSVPFCGEKKKLKKKKQ